MFPIALLQILMILNIEYDTGLLVRSVVNTSTLAPSVPALMLCALMRRPVSHISVIASQVKRRLQLSR